MALRWRQNSGAIIAIDINWRINRITTIGSISAATRINTPVAVKTHIAASISSEAERSGGKSRKSRRNFDSSAVGSMDKSIPPERSRNDAPNLGPATSLVPEKCRMIFLYWFVF